MTRAPDHSPRSRPARHPPGGAWSAEMRADMAAAYLDYPTSGKLFAAIRRGEAPPPTATRMRDGRREPVWALDAVRDHVAFRHRLSSDAPRERDSIGGLI